MRESRINTVSTAAVTIPIRHNTALLYDTSAALNKEEVIPVTDAQWAAFRQELDEIGVWDWQREYDNLAMDGIQWEINIAYADKKIRSDGSNAYPGSEGDEVSVIFCRFLEAVRLLMPGRKFE